MKILLDNVIEAHGGLHRWQQHSALSVELSVGGLLWGMKEQAGVLDNTKVTVGIGNEWASHHPFGQDNRRSRFAPDVVTIEGQSGGCLERLDNPRGSFANHKLETPWSEPQLAYFAGYAMWTYLNLPFLALRSDVTVEDLPLWQENGEEWTPFRLTFPDTIATHSRVQTIYAGSDGLLRRHDYAVEIAGDSPGAHYIDRYTDVDGISFPTKRRVYAVDDKNQPIRTIMTVSIDLSNFHFVD